MLNHLVRPKSKGLFTAAAIQSGTSGLAGGLIGEDLYEQVYTGVLKASGCSGVACLRKLSGDALLKVRTLIIFAYLGM